MVKDKKIESYGIPDLLYKGLVTLDHSALDKLANKVE